MVSRDGRSISLRVIFFPLLVVAIPVLVWVFRQPLGALLESVETLEKYIEGAGWWAPVALVGLQFLQVVVFIIPGEIVQVAAGYLYGVAGGTALSVLGISLGSVVNFLIGRHFGAPFMKVVAPRRFDRFQYLTSSRRGELGFFLLFVIPGFPKDVLSYIAGISLLRFYRFFLFSLIGRLPGIVGSTLIGSSAARGHFVLSVVILLIASLVGGIAMVFRDRLNGYLRRRVG